MYEQHVEECVKQGFLALFFRSMAYGLLGVGLLTLAVAITVAMDLHSFLCLFPASVPLYAAWVAYCLHKEAERKAQLPTFPEPNLDLAQALIEMHEEIGSQIELPPARYKEIQTLQDAEELMQRDILMQGLYGHIRTQDTQVTDR